MSINKKCNDKTMKNKKTLESNSHLKSFIKFVYSFFFAANKCLLECSFYCRSDHDMLHRAACMQVNIHTTKQNIIRHFVQFFFFWNFFVSYNPFSTILCICPDFSALCKTIFIYFMCTSLI